MLSLGAYVVLPLLQLHGVCCVEPVFLYGSCEGKFDAVEWLCFENWGLVIDHMEVTPEG